MYSLISQSCIDKDDFHRITYECLSRCAEHGTRYVELFFDAEDHAIRVMADAGLKIMINSDDPPMMHTDLTNEYMLMMDKLKFGIEDIKTFILNGVDGAWLDESTKRQWRSEWSAEIDKIILE